MEIRKQGDWAERHGRGGAGRQATHKKGRERRETGMWSGAEWEKRVENGVERGFSGDNFEVKMS